MKLSAIVTGESDKKLSEIIKKQECCPGYGQGISITEIKYIPKKYRVSFHRGEIEDEAGYIRIVNGIILAGKFTDFIEEILRDNKIGFKEYNGLEITNPDSKKLNINIPKREPNLIYNL